MAEVYRGVARIRHSSPRRFTLVAIYRNAYSGIQTISHLLEEPLAERDMRAHLRRTGFDEDEVEAALAAAGKTEVDRL
jgi:hypothetical protein